MIIPDDPNSLTPAHKQKLLALNEATRAVALEFIQPPGTLYDVHEARCKTMDFRVADISVTFR